MDDAAQFRGIWIEFIFIYCRTLQAGFQHALQLAFQYIGYTEDNLGRSSGHVGGSLQICEKYPTKMVRENHIASRSLPLESKGDFKLKVVKSWRGVKL